MTANVPTSENGSARLGMIVADRLRRKRKMTRTTSANVRESVNCTSGSVGRVLPELPPLGSASPSAAPAVQAVLAREVLRLSAGRRGSSRAPLAAAPTAVLTPVG